MLIRLDPFERCFEAGHMRSVITFPLLKERSSKSGCYKKDGHYKSRSVTCELLKCAFRLVCNITYLQFVGFSLLKKSFSYSLLFYGFPITYSVLYILHVDAVIYKRNSTA
ncbi:uncharacterized protein LOC114880768 [Osmia bicornis bicornis]|uniref:uncharacterized protein LOC114880768 n=1 Tax=Osmia bicornis bicornis TaxID=1437191 RepID=UPI0010F5BB69|nr:uncharacterized protein LOC114880768 [Osmia bicornis bicornis]